MSTKYFHYRYAFPGGFGEGILTCEDQFDLVKAMRAALTHTGGAGALLGWQEITAQQAGEYAQFIEERKKVGTG